MNGEGPSSCDVKILGVPLNGDTDEYRQRQYWQEDCGQDGCLFNLRDDPTEHKNLVGHEDTRQELLAFLVHLNESVFFPERGDGKFEACERAMQNGGFYGPFVDADDFYTGPLEPMTDASLELQLREVARNPILRSFVVYSFQKNYPAEYLVGSNNGAIGPFDTCFAPFHQIADAEVYKAHANMSGQW
jgi:hypothetical protein